MKNVLSQRWGNSKGFTSIFYRTFEDGFLFNFLRKIVFSVKFSIVSPLLVTDFKTTSLLNSSGHVREAEALPTPTESFSAGSSTFTEQTQTTAKSQSNLLELTTEKLSLTNELSLSSRLVSESLTLSTTTIDVASNRTVSNSTHNSKQTGKQKLSSNSLSKSTNDGGVRISGQKIEMPILNDFFDHSAYLKKHEHGFR